MKNKLFASVPNILFGALITIAPQTFAHACTGHDMPGAATTRSRRPPASVSSSSCSASRLCSSAPQIRIGLNIAAAADACYYSPYPPF